MLNESIVQSLLFECVASIAANGAVCSMNSECASNVCTRGVCCAQICGECTTCDAAGACVPTCNNALGCAATMGDCASGSLACSNVLSGRSGNACNAIASVCAYVCHTRVSHLRVQMYHDCVS